MQFANTPRTTEGATRFPIRLFIVVLILFAGVTLYFQWKAKEEPFDVVIEVLGETPRTLTTLGGSVEDLLRSAGIEVGPHDLVTPSLDDEVTAELLIQVRRAMPVNISVDGQDEEHWVVGATVRDAIAQAGIQINSLDRVTPAQSSPLESDLHVRIVRVVEEFIDETEALPFKVLRWAAPDLERGQTTVIREGREGIIQNKVRVIYEDGRPVTRTIVSSEVIQPVVDRVIGEGTRTPSQTVDTPDGPLPYIEVREMVATGYEPGPISTGEWSDGLTFTGLKAERGVIAVDPTVIPLGTRLYVEGYGEGIAADIGGAIKGNRIDLCFDTYNEAIQWGRQTVKVYVLAP